MKVKAICKYDLPRSKMVKFCDGKKNFDLIIKNDSMFQKIELENFYTVKFDGKFLTMIEDSQFDDYETLLEQNISFRDGFTYDHEHLKQLDARYKKFLSVVLKAVIEGRPIYLKHDNDPDGFSSGVQLELAIKELKTKFDRANSQNINRSTMVPPWYALEDAFFDIPLITRNGIPLVLVLDHGSTAQDLDAINYLKHFGCKVGVIDHHEFNGDLRVDEVVDCHINPYLEGGDSSLCTGVLTYELIKRMGCDTLDHVPGIPALADRCPQEIIDNYNVYGDKLDVYAEAMKFFTVTARSQTLPLFFNEFFKNPESYYDICKSIVDRDRRKKDEVKAKLAHYVKVEKLGNTNFSYFVVDEVVPRDVGLGTSGIAGLIVDEIIEEPCIVAVKGPYGFTFRVNEGVNFSVIDFMNHVQSKWPNAFFMGGGHPQAGTFTVPKIHLDEVLVELRDYISKL